MIPYMCVSGIIFTLLTNSNNAGASSSNTLCPGCPDPVNRTKDNPCGSCEHSQCKYEGCVTRGAFFEYWKPSPCTICFCKGGRKKECIQHHCPGYLECFGFPTITRPGKCCAECNFGVSPDDCDVVPVKYRWIQYLGFYKKQSAFKRLLYHGCNKDIVEVGNKLYKCQPQIGLASVASSTGCESLEGSYHDVVHCVKVELKDDEIPADYGTTEKC